MNRLSVVAVLAALAFAACKPETQTPPPATVPGPEKRLAEHVVIISIDGCRPDVMLRAGSPNLRALMQRGSFNMYAETTYVAITLPSHTSMLTGVTPERHRITWNKDRPREELRSPAFPTLFDVAKKHGLSTAMIAGKSKLDALTLSGAVDFVEVAKEVAGSDDVAVGEKAAAIITAHKPNVTFVHLANTDVTGHSLGWGTAEQMAAINLADQAVGIIVKAINDAGVTDKTLVIVSADHGGSGITHGKNDPRSRYIPWICVGPDVREDHDLTLERGRTIRTEDTFATACYFLNIPIDPRIDGRPVMNLFTDRELLQPK